MWAGLGWGGGTNEDFLRKKFPSIPCSFRPESWGFFFSVYTILWGGAKMGRSVVM